MIPSSVRRIYSVAEKIFIITYISFLTTTWIPLKTRAMLGMYNNVKRCNYMILTHLAMNGAVNRAIDSIKNVSRTHATDRRSTRWMYLWYAANVESSLVALLGTYMFAQRTESQHLYSIAIKHIPAPKHRSTTTMKWTRMLSGVTNVRCERIPFGWPLASILLLCNKTHKEKSLSRQLFLDAKDAHILLSNTPMWP